MINPSMPPAHPPDSEEKTVLSQESPKIKILIIPHQPHRNLKVRAIEMARFLASDSRYQVFTLTWETDATPYANVPKKLLGKTGGLCKSMRIPRTITEEAGVHWVRLPYMLTPYPVCQWFNRWQLSQFLAEQGIQLVISGNAYHFPMPQNNGIHRIYDVVDDHLSPDSGPVWQRTHQFTLRELRQADQIMAISHALQAELEKAGFAQSHYVPNGVDYAAFTQTNPAEIEAIRHQHQLHNRFVIGYIGNHGWWSGMALLMDAFQKLQTRHPNRCKLLIVGPGEELAHYRQQAASNPDIILTGPIAPQSVAAYFHVSSIGVLPFQQCPFTDNAMPLKILEYGAARKTVIATPLKELITLSLPHVALVEAEGELWASRLAQEMHTPTPWQPEWDSVIQQFDWRTVLAPLKGLLTSHFGEPHAPAV